MALSKPALISAFVCPGLGQWAAGRRVLGAILVFFAVTSAASPFVAFIIGVLTPPPCDFFLEGLLECNKRALVAAFWTALPVLAVAAPVFAIVYVTAVVHANGLTIPAKTASG